MKHVSKAKASFSNNEMSIEWETADGVKGKIAFNESGFVNPNYVNREFAEAVFNKFLDDVWNTAETFDYDIREL